MKHPKLPAVTSAPSLPVKNEIRQFLACKEAPMRALLFLGAGAGYDSKAPEALRLPLGSGVMDRLLRFKYGEVDEKYRDLPKEEARRKMFCEANPSVVLTPDNVWERLIQEPGAIRNYHPILEELFSKQKPIPPAYYMAGRWLYGPTANTCVVTTNYDEHLDRALQEIAAIVGKDPDGGVHISTVRDDFAALYTADHGMDSRVLKVHGTLSHPWSIIAGDKASALKARRAKGKPDWRKDPRYATMESALIHHKTWVFVGFSFTDTIIPEIIRAALEKRKPDPTTIFVVGPSTPLGAQKAFRRTGKLVNLRFVHWTAEAFFQFLLNNLEDPKLAPSARLSKGERLVLQKGAEFPECERARLLGTRGEVQFDDIVHGPIIFDNRIEQQLIRLIDSGEVQRLRNIKQLSFVNLKYPGAVHDRFGHVLGVTCLADKLFASLRATPSQDPEIERRLQLKDSDHLAFCGAALLHDIGHGPFGHAMDLVREQIKWAPSHEDDSEEMLKMADKDDSFGDLGQAIRDANLQVTQIWSVFQSAEGGQSHSMKSALATNESLDIDRLDFIVRDALYAQPGGAKEGKKWLERAYAVRAKLGEIIKGLKPFIGSKNAIEFRYRVDHLPELQQAADLYTHLYENVYYCWENISAQHMLRVAVTELLKTTKYRFTEILPAVDGELVKILEDFDHPHVRDLTYMIKNRRLYPPLLRATIRPTDDVYEDATALRAWKQQFKEFTGRLRQFCLTELKCNQFVLLWDVKGPRTFPVIFNDGVRGRSQRNLSTMPGIVQILHWPSAKFDRAALERFVRKELGALNHKEMQFRSWLGTGTVTPSQPELPIA